MNFGENTYTFAKTKRDQTNRIVLVFGFSPAQTAKGASAQYSSAGRRISQVVVEYRLTEHSMVTSVW